MYTEKVTNSTVKEDSSTAPQWMAQDLLSKLYQKQIPEPTFDQDKADRLQRMGRINQAGRSLSVLGDVLTTALGGSVRRRQPDTLAPALYQSYQANLDKYKFEKDQHLLRDYEKDRQDLIYGIGRADRDDELAYRDRRQTSAERLAALRAKQDWNKYQTGLTQKQKEQAERERHNKAMENKRTGSGNKANMPVKIQTAKKTYTLSPEEAARYRGEIINNSTLLKEKYGEWFTDQPVRNKYGRETGERKMELDPRIKDDQLIRAYLELKEDEEEKKNSPVSKPDAGIQQQNVQQGKPFSFPGLGKKAPSFFQDPKSRNNSKIGENKIDYSKLNYGNQDEPSTKFKGVPKGGF